MEKIERKDKNEKVRERTAEGAPKLDMSKYDDGVHKGRQNEEEAVLENHIMEQNIGINDILEFNTVLSKRHSVRPSEAVEDHGVKEGEVQILEPIQKKQR